MLHLLSLSLGYLCFCNPLACYFTPILANPWGTLGFVVVSHSQAIEVNLTDIILKNLHKSFGNFVAVQNTDLTIKNGEFFVLLGPSGCSKTTTLR